MRDAFSQYLLDLGFGKLQDFPKVCEYLEAQQPLPVVIKEVFRVEKTETEALIFFNTGDKPSWVLGKNAKKEEWEFTGESEKVWMIPPTASVLQTNMKPLLQIIEPRLTTLVKPVPVEARLEPTVDLPQAESPTQLEDKRLLLREPLKKTKGSKKGKGGKAKVKVDRSLRTEFKKRLSALDIEKLKKPWMGKYHNGYMGVFTLIDTEEAFQDWAQAALCVGRYADRSRDHWRPNLNNELVPVLAVDTETIGLDNRIIIDKDAGGNFIYEVKAEIAGLCLSVNGVNGIYIPINHDVGKCVSRAAVQRILQWLFDRCHLVFYNAKFDREIIRICLGVTPRPYPHFEDVQVLQYDNDPKADLDDQKGGHASDAGGLKMLSKNLLGLEQIELDDIAKVKASMVDPVTCTCKHSRAQHNGACTAHACVCAAFVARETLRVQMAPFNWIPTDIALYYAAADAICTWLLWEKCIYPARARRNIHRIDHRLVDTITWIERQRFLLDTERHAKTVVWHQSKLREIEAKLQAIAVEYGWPVQYGPDGNILAHTQINVTSQPQIAKLLFDIKKMKIVKKSRKTNKPSVDADALKDLNKLYPNDKFLTQFDEQKKYIALHPENLRWEPKDHTVRVFFRTNVVAGGRLAASGGEFEVDGGFGLNPQGIKKPSKNWFVRGNILVPDVIPEESIEEHTQAELHPSCLRNDGKKKAPGIVKNHIGNYLGYAVCLVPTCTTCGQKYGILMEDQQLDAAEVLNLRALFIAPPGWTLFSIDYSNIEMRAAANCSGEPKFVNEFIHGSGDFHALTATNVFPEYSDPNTPQEIKDDLRGIAKIINFAMLYGGTAHAIVENLKKLKPYNEMTLDALRAKCEDMVAKYWEGVPKFKEFCDLKQREAREGPVPSNEPRWDPNTTYYHGDIVQYESGGTSSVYTCLHKGMDGVFGGGEPSSSENWIKYMRCTTNVGRIISFVSAMEHMGLHPPTKQENRAYSKYLFHKGEARDAEAAGDFELAKIASDKAQELWKDPATGVKNFIDFQRFYSKIQRVSVNTPLQGLAGDFMRMALNRICEYATRREPLLQTIMRLHATIHDEIDFIVKNEYVPFVIPRITRLMKLRTLHVEKKWPVPIESDVEYGHSWDVEYKATKYGYTKIAGLEHYVPTDMRDSFQPLLDALLSGDETRRAKVKTWCEREFHTKLQVVDPKGKEKNMIQRLFSAKPEDVAEVLTIALQTNEMWTLDHVPDTAEDQLETLQQYEARIGLGPETRDPMYPVFGYLGAIPLDSNVIRPQLMRLDDGTEVLLTPAETPTTGEPTGVAPEPPDGQQSLFQTAPVPVLEPTPLKILSKGEKLRLFDALGKGRGPYQVPVVYVVNGTPVPGTIKDCLSTMIPDEFKDTACLT